MKSKDDKNLLEAYSKVLKENCGIMGDMIVAPTETEHPQYADSSSREQEETSMDETNASIILQKANELVSLLQSGFRLEPWMQQKITLAADYLASVSDTAASNKQVSEANIGIQADTKFKRPNKARQFVKKQKNKNDRRQAKMATNKITKGNTDDDTDIPDDDTDIPDNSKKYKGWLS